MYVCKAYGDVYSVVAARKGTLKPITLWTETWSGGTGWMLLWPPCEPLPLGRTLELRPDWINKLQHTIMALRRNAIELYIYCA
jgi:hypothetical protein